MRWHEVGFLLKRTGRAGNPDISPLHLKDVDCQMMQGLLFATVSTLELVPVESIVSLRGILHTPSSPR
jgi:hypothetical protein